MPVTVRTLNGDIFEIPANMINHVPLILNLIREQFHLPHNSPFEVKVYNLSQNSVEVRPRHIIGPDDELLAVAVEDDQALHFAHKSSTKKKKSIGKKKKSIGKKKKNKNKDKNIK